MALCCVFADVVHSFIVSLDCSIDAPKKKKRKSKSATLSDGEEGTLTVSLYHVL